MGFGGEIRPVVAEAVGNAGCVPDIPYPRVERRWLPIMVALVDLAIVVEAVGQERVVIPADLDPQGIVEMDEVVDVGVAGGLGVYINAYPVVLDVISSDHVVLGLNEVQSHPAVVDKVLSGQAVHAVLDQDSNSYEGR